ncbi:MAG: signal peptide peptidase SppA [Candidatus Latescibacterota bacterium]
MTRPRGRIVRLLIGCWRALDLARRIAFNLLFGLILLAVVVALVRVDRDEVPESAVLVLDPEGRLVEQLSHVPPAMLLLREGIEERVAAETGVRDLVEGIDAARADPRVAAVFLDLRRLEGSGLSKLEEVGEALTRLREGGKPVIAWGDQYTQTQYYLAAHASEIYLHPMGGVALQGYGVYRTYFRAALEKLRVQVHAFRVGTYKSALEPFLRDDMSGEDRDASLTWLNGLWQSYRTAVAGQRHLAPEALDRYIDDWRGYLERAEGDAARAALDLGLIDGIETRHQTRERVLRAAGGTTRAREIRLAEYLRQLRSHRRPTGPAGYRVGVITACGVLLGGKQPPGRIGDESLAELLGRARTDDAIRAVVLRLDTPGGSALAAETIGQEIALLRQAGKPVVASLGSTAASGGYWIAAATDQIWAAPTTITGSIGIFGAFPTFERSLDALGIHADGVGTHARSDALDPRLPLDPEAAGALQLLVERGYRRFVERVAEGRHLDPAAVEAVAQGRVWTGEQARALGLVDSLGGVSQAIAAAARLAQLEEYGVTWIEREPGAGEQLLRSLAERTGPLVEAETGWSLPEVLRSTGREVEVIARMADPQGVYAWCLTCSTE